MYRKLPGTLLPPRAARPGGFQRVGALPLHRQPQPPAHGEAGGEPTDRPAARVAVDLQLRRRLREGAPGRRSGALPGRDDLQVRPVAPAPPVREDAERVDVVGADGEEESAVLGAAVPGPDPAVCALMS